MIIGITGNRPAKLPPEYGYDYNRPAWRKYRQRLKSVIHRYQADKVIVGMSLGADTVAAMTVLEMREKGCDIKLVCAIPFKGQESAWPKSSQALYNEILSKADEVVVVSEGKYSAAAMQKRNQYIVAFSDLVIALWTGEQGGTANCIASCREYEKPVIWLKPSEIVVYNNITVDEKAAS